MKVILIKAIPSLGLAGDLKNVSDGYARNHLIPQKLVIPATPSNQSKAEALKKSQEHKSKKRIKLDTKTFQLLDNCQIKFKVKATPEGTLFAGLNTQDVIAAIKEKQGIELLSEAVGLDRPIKKVGECTVPITLGQKKAMIKIIVEAKNEK